MTVLGDHLPERPSKEAFHAAEINEAYDAFSGWLDAVQRDPEFLPPYITTSHFTFEDFTPPFPFPRAVIRANSPISKIDVRIEKNEDELVSAALAIWHNGDVAPSHLYERTDLFGDDLFVSVDAKGVPIDSSLRTSREIEELMFNLALTRDLRLKLALGKASKEITSLERIGNLSPLIAAGLENNAAIFTRTDCYSFIVADSPDQEHDVTFNHTEGPEGSEYFARIHTVRRDGDVITTSDVAVTLTKTIDLDRPNAAYLAQLEGFVEIFDHDFPSSTVTETMDSEKILELITATLQYATKDVIEKCSDPIVTQLPHNELD